MKRTRGACCITQNSNIYTLKIMLNQQSNKSQQQQLRYHYYNNKHKQTGYVCIFKSTYLYY